MLSFCLLCRTCVLLSLSLVLPVSAASLELAEVSTQAAQAFSPTTPVASVVMTGTAQWSAGGKTFSGPVKLTANVNGQNSAEFDLSNGTRVETQSAIADDRTCTWTGKDGTAHNVASSNCWTSTVWFLPHLALQTVGQPTSLQRAPISDSVPHLRYSLHIAPGRTSAATTALIQTWSQADLKLDHTTLLPASLKYSIHPDQNSSVDLQVEVRYSNYKAVSGVQLPMHIERYVNGTVQVSIDIASAVIN